MTFGERIKQLRIETKETQKDISLLTGVETRTVGKWEQINTTPGNDILKKLAEHFNCSIDYLLGASDERTTKQAVKIPVLGCIQAGLPMYAAENILDYEEISDKVARSGEIFALYARGDSMAPEIQNHDVLFFRKQEDANDGDICAILVNGNDATVKRIHKGIDGVTLIPNNKIYGDMFYSNEQIKNLPVQIIGKLIEIRRSY